MGFSEKGKKKITPHHCTMVGFINYHQKNIIFRARIVHQLTLSPSGTLLFCGLPIMFWQKNLQRIFEFDNIEKQLKKIVKSECEEGYSNDLKEFVFGAHFFKRSSFKKYSKCVKYQFDK